jgi:hypothetical protein
MESSGTGAGPKGMIRHQQTGHYYRGAGKWTQNVREAMEFENVALAVAEAKRFGLGSGCEFVVEFDGKIGFRVFLPL